MNLKNKIRKGFLDWSYVCGMIAASVLAYGYYKLRNYCLIAMPDVNVNLIYLILNFLFMLLSVYTINLAGYSKGVFGKTRIKKYSLMKKNRYFFIMLLVVFLIGMLEYYPWNIYLIPKFIYYSITGKMVWNYAIIGDVLWNSIVFTLWMAFSSSFEENIICGIIGESNALEHRETEKGIILAIMITFAFALIVDSNIVPYAWIDDFVLGMIAAEFIFTRLFYEGKDIQTIKQYRFIFKTLMVMGYTLLLPREDLWGMPSPPRGVFNIIVLILICTGISVVAWKIRKKSSREIWRYQISDIMRKYALYGLRYASKSMYVEDSVFKKHLDNTSFKKDSKIRFLNELVVYCGLSCIVALLAIPVANRFLGGSMGSIDFVRTYGVDLLIAQLSTTFLIVSFLSFLTSRDDYILWEDTMSYRLIHPKQINFISLSVYSFASMFFSAIYYGHKWDVLVIVFFVLGFALLTFLTFRMVRIFFNRKGLLRELEMNYCNADFEKKKHILSELFQNSCNVIEDNDGRRIQENFNFLVKLYCVYNRQLLSHHNTQMPESEDYPGGLVLLFMPKDYRYLQYELYNRKDEQHISFVSEDMLLNGGASLKEDKEKKKSIFVRIYDYWFGEINDNDGNGFTQTEYDILKRMEEGLNPSKETAYNHLTELYSIVCDEITHFVSLLLSVNPTLLAKMLKGYNSKIFEIDGISHEICNYIVNSVENDKSTGVVLMLLRDVLQEYLAIHKSLINELPLLKNLNNQEEKETEKLTFWDDGFLFGLYSGFRELKSVYGDLFEDAYTGVVSEYEGGYIKMEEISKELESLRNCGNISIETAYRKWNENVFDAYGAFKEEIKADRESQFSKDKLVLQ